MHELLISEAREQADCLLPAFHQWLCDDESVWCRFFRVENDYLIRFPGLADFKISSPDSVITCWPAPDIAEADIRQLYLNQVLPLAQSHSGNLVFHASAIEVNQHAIAFVGMSGRGKSTMAASFSTQQYRFLSDDGLLLEKTGTGYRVMPSHASIRLWEDSQAAVLGQHAAFETPLEYSTKLRFSASKQMLHCEQPCFLHRCYFLGDSDTENIEFTQLSAQQASIELIKHSFLLDIENKAMLKKHLADVAELSCLGIFYLLNYPRKYSLLADVRQAILAHAELNHRPNKAI